MTTGFLKSEDSIVLIVAAASSFGLAERRSTLGESLPRQRSRNGVAKPNVEVIGWEDI